jgi:ABC-type multidrug transport system fused ATPase/permease subunit
MPRVTESGWLWKRLRPYTPRVLLGLAIAILSGASGTLDPLLMRYLIDVALPRGKMEVSPRAVLIIALCVVLISLFSLGRSALGSLGGKLSFRVAQLLGQDLKVELLAHMTRLSADWHERVFLGEKLSRVENDVGQISQFGADFANQAVRSVVFFIANLAIMFTMNWRITVSVLPLLPIFVWVRSRFRGKMRSCADLSRAEIGKASGSLAEHLGAVPDIQILGAEEVRTSRTVESWEDALSAQWAQRSAEVSFSVAVNSVLALGILIVLGFGVYEYFLGALSLGGFVAFYTYVLRIFDPVAGAMELYSRTQQMMASSRRVREVLETSPSVPDHGDVEAVPAPLVSGLACKAVSFAYPLGETVLRSVDLRIGRNERIALIGTSGSGKSTLSRLLARMADPTSGSIILEGRPIPEYRLKTLRRAICYVPQHPVLFSGTIRQNLLDANPAASQTEIDEVVDAAQLQPVVSRLANGLDSVLGPEATGLSGGERQRLALARALLRHSPILVLDEATSALDLPTEEAVFRAVASFRPGMAVVLISHRLRSLTWVDRMILLDSGSVVAQGTHSSLYRESVLYRRLYENDDVVDQRAAKVDRDGGGSIDARGEGLLVEL